MDRLEYSPEAERDLQDIWDYTFENWSESQAEKYLWILRDACREIASNPRLGKNYERIPDKYLGYREGRHTVFYRMASPDKIVIVRILHGNMNFENKML